MLLDGSHIFMMFLKIMSIQRVCNDHLRLFFDISAQSIGLYQYSNNSNNSNISNFERLHYYLDFDSFLQVSTE